MNGFGVDPAVLPAFALAMVLIELTPGPNLAWLALLGAGQGRRIGLLAVAGITAGLVFWLLVALFGLTRTPLHSLLGLEILRWFGVAYLVWLAWDALRPGTGVGPTGRPSGGRAFLRGLAANLLNPKAAIFYLALLPGFINPTIGPLLPQVLILGGVHIAISIVIHSAAVFGAAEAASRLPPRWLLGFRVFLALGLVATAFWMLTIPLSMGPAT
jgi:threonine/homoserine/homoserine lactone efflux protein